MDKKFRGLFLRDDILYDEYSIWAKVLLAYILKVRYYTEDIHFRLSTVADNYFATNGAIRRALRTLEEEGLIKFSFETKKMIRVITLDKAINKRYPGAIEIKDGIKITGKISSKSEQEQWDIPYTRGTYKERETYGD